MLEEATINTPPRVFFQFQTKEKLKVNAKNKYNELKKKKKTLTSEGPSHVERAVLKKSWHKGTEKVELKYTILS